MWHMNSWELARSRNFAWRKLGIGFVGIAAMSMSGCIAGEIRDSLVEVNESLARTNASLDLVMSELQLRLHHMEPIEAELTSIDAELAGVSTSLDRLDDHLVSLRRTLQNIDSTIPFLKLADDEEIEDRPEDGAPAEAPDEQGGAPEPPQE